MRLGTMRTGDLMFASTVAAIVAFGFVCVVVSTTFIDPRLTTCFLYGARTYKFGYWSALLSVVIFVATGCGVYKSKSRWFKCLHCWISQILVSIPVMWFFFQPEFPHASILLWVFSYSAVAMICVWIRYEELAIFDASKATRESRLEQIRSTVTNWRTLTVTIIAGYLALAVPWVRSVYDISCGIVSDPGEANLLAATFTFQVAVFSLVVVVGPVKEAYSKLREATEQFSAVDQH